LGRDGSSAVAGRGLAEIIQEMWNTAMHREGKSFSRSSAVSLTLLGNRSYISTVVYIKPQILSNEKLQTNQNMNLLIGYIVINFSLRRVYCVV
jgi:hypothetical protein